MSHMPFQWILPVTVLVAMATLGCRSLQGAGDASLKVAEGSDLSHPSYPDGASRVAPAASPQGRGNLEQYGGGRLAVSTYGGFTVNPEAFLFAAEGLYRLGKESEGRRGQLSAGGLMQIGVEGGHLLLAWSPMGRYTFNVPSRPRLKPFAEAGVGFLLSKKRNDALFGSALFIVGGGVEFMVRENIGVGGKGYLNFAPGPGEDFFASILGGASFYF